MSILLYENIREEARIAFLLSKYITLEDETIDKIIKTILFYLPENNYLNGEKYLMIARLVQDKKLSRESIMNIEKFLVKHFSMFENKRYKDLTNNGYGTKDFSNMIKYYDDSFISESISNIVIKLNDEDKKKRDFAFSIASAPSLQA